MLGFTMAGYRRKSDRGKFGQAALNEAIQKVKAGEISKRKAEQMFGVPRKTLSGHILGKVNKPGSLGRFKCVLPVEIEEAIVNHAIKLQRMLFGLSTADLQRLAFEIAERQKIPHSFKGKMAGNSWLRGFLARHPGLAILCACGRHTVSYWSTHGSDDSLAGYQATAATTEELTADCCDRQQ